MQCGDHRDVDAVCGQYLLGHERRRSMGDGITHMQYVELFKPYHIHQFARQRKFVGGEVEQRVFGYRYLMIVEVFRKEIKPGGLAVGDKVNLLPVGSQCFAHFRSDYTASTKGGERKSVV